MSETVFKTSHVVTTELGRINQLTAAVATKFLKLPETTINSKRGVLADEEVSTFPRIRYFGIGIRGYANISSENNIAQPYQPSPSNMDLYEPIPFRCTKVALTQEEASKYRMVTRVKIGDTWYFQYWLKLLEFETDQPKITTITGNRESSYTLDASNLNPVPTDLNATDVSNSDGVRTEVSLTAIRRVTGTEVCEVINAMYNGDLRRARISEFGFYSGIEKKNCTMAALTGAPSIDYSYNEAAYVQLASHMCTIGHDLSSEQAVLTERCVIQNGALIKS